MSNHFSFDLTAIDERNADFDIFAISDHQNLVKLNRFTSCDVQLFQANGLTFAYSVLFTTTLENRVHIKLRFPRAQLFSTERAINIHNRARILRNNPAYDKSRLGPEGEKRRKKTQFLSQRLSGPIFKYNQQDSYRHVPM
ncbi:Octaprenyl-diphosphate synthase [Serratia fonticola AU-AP2C]|nr:Octaprenyl-diphosphate synthase [Serratia fonticola AU-AP2C]